MAVYRFDTKLGTQLYTGNQSEHDVIAAPGGAGFRADLISEGVAFYAPTGLFK